MDPNRTLRDLLDWAHSWADHPSDHPEEQALGWIAQSLLDLDQWLSRGGFLPRRWDSAASPKLTSAAKDLREARDILARLLGEKASQ